jgi:hypothetical protein
MGIKILGDFSVLPPKDDVEMLRIGALNIPIIGRRAEMFFVEKARNTWVIQKDHPKGMGMPEFVLLICMRGLVPSKDSESGFKFVGQGGQCPMAKVKDGHGLVAVDLDHSSGGGQWFTTTHRNTVAWGEGEAALQRFKLTPTPPPARKPSPLAMATLARIKNPSAPKPGLTFHMEIPDLPVEK